MKATLKFVKVYQKTFRLIICKSEKNLKTKFTNYSIFSVHDQFSTQFLICNTGIILDFSFHFTVV